MIKNGKCSKSFKRVAPDREPLPSDPLPEPALSGPTLQRAGEPYDQWNAYWKGREFILLLREHPEAVAAGIRAEIARQGLHAPQVLATLLERVYAAGGQQR